MKHGLKFILPLLAVCVFILQPASAATITYTATGCFFGGTLGTSTCTPGSDPTAIQTFQDLRYQGSAGTVTVLPDPIDPGTFSASASFGSFWFFSIPPMFTSETFDGGFILQLVLTSPAPGGNVTATATVRGTLSGPNPPTAAGSNVAITYPAQYQHPTGTPGGVFLYDFVDPANGGSGRLGFHVQSITVPVSALGIANAVTEPGHFHETSVVPPTVPEPGTYALFGGGLLALGLIRRRKRA